MWAALLTGMGKVAGALADWWSARTKTQLDNQVRTDQIAADTAKGATDELAQVSKVGAALDAPDSGVSTDPANRNR